MRSSTGNVLRTVGLVIEMVGVGCVYQTSMNNAQPPGPNSQILSILSWITVGLGFVLWLTGWLIGVLSHRSRRKAIWQDQQELRP